MNVMALAKGASAGIVAGAAVYAYTNARSSKKRRLKSKTAKAIHAVGDIAETMAEFMF